ncbi:MAG: DeoR/GlpR transcriptional regulator [Flavobacteriaceae bacterium]|nr:DeoR/GlpR transcriptional regulator [Flavobacteriaceae bacterium]
MTALNERHQQILAYLENRKFVTVQELSELAKVSLVTIRKDLTLLEKEGYLYRTHGGASKKSRYAFEENVIKKESINTFEKELIAKKASEYINDNDFIILASGTTIHYLARIIDNNKNITILTSSLRVSLELSKFTNINVIQLGGKLRKSSSSVIGSMTEDMLRNFSCTKLFLGIDGIDPDFGISTSNAAEAHLNRVMIEQADTVYVLGDSSKINKRGFGRICGLENVNAFITDANIEKDDLFNLEKAGVDVIVAE